MTNITNEMAEAGAKVLDAVPCLDVADFRQVVRDVYAAMREAEGVRDVRVEVPPYTMRVGLDGQEWREFMRERLADAFGLPDRMVRPAATSDGRW